MTNKSPKYYIDQFFIKDGGEMQGSWVRRSVLLNLVEDLKKCSIYPNNYFDKRLKQDLPFFTIIALFCMGIDLLARVKFRREPPPGKNGKYFKFSARNYFKANQKEAEALWAMRNDIMHSYRLSDKCWVTLGGGSKFIKTLNSGGSLYILKEMLSTLQSASNKLYDEIVAEKPNKKLAFAVYLIDKGFYLTKD